MSKSTRTIHRNAVRQFLNGNAKPLGLITQQAKMINAGDTLRRKFKRRMDSITGER